MSINTDVLRIEERTLARLGRAYTAGLLRLAAREIDQLRADEAILRALLTDVKRFVWLADPPQALTEDLLARVDAALDGNS